MEIELELFIDVILPTTQPLAQTGIGNIFGISH
jgi:hypothetical protein